ncbi:hypothetical protein ACHWQZ_G007379 [Mnemiopsis leidyi]
MPPEIITTKRDTEIGRLLERVIRDHRKDISAFSKGHLNENNLYKPPEAGRKSWETAKLPAIKLKHAVSAGKETRDKKMWEAVACFSAGSAFPTSLPSSPATRRELPNEDIIEGLGLDEDNVNLEEFDASYFLLPKPGGFKVMPSLNGCIRKKDEIEQRKMYDELVIEKHNLTDRGWYNGTRALKNMKVNKTIDKADIQVSQQLWEELLSRCTGYNPLLGDIKDFYNGYLEFLKEKSKQTLSTPNKKVAQLSEKNKEITRLTKLVSELEFKAMEKMRANENLKEEHVVTETVLSEIKVQTEVVESTSSTDMSLAEPPSIADNVDQLRRSILHKRAEINQLRKYQRQAMVPMEVYQCMVQCVQSAEIELQKQIKSKEGLEKKKAKNIEQIEAQSERLALTPAQIKQLLQLVNSPEPSESTPSET